MAILLTLPFLLSGPARAVARESQLPGPQPVLLVDTYSNRYDDLFRYYSSLNFGPFVDWRWFKAQAVAESLLDSGAESLKGAVGLMQLLPSTFEEVTYGQSYAGNIHDPQVNIAAGLKYNRSLFRRWNGLFNGNDRFLLMLASYNAGYYRVYTSFRDADAVREWDDIKEQLPAETRDYVRRILKLMQPMNTGENALLAGLTGADRR